MTQTSVPSTVSTLSRSASPGGGWSGSASAVDTIDGIVLSSSPWNGNSSGWTSGQSDLLIATGFGFSFPPTDTLIAIYASFSYLLGKPRQAIGLHFGDDLYAEFDLIQGYVGGLTGGISSSSPFRGFGGSTGTFAVSLALSPTIAQINSGSFGVAVGATGFVTSTYTTSDGNPLQVALDQVQLTIITASSSGGNGGGGGGGGGNGGNSTTGVYFDPPYIFPPIGVRI